MARGVELRQAQKQGSSGMPRIESCRTTSALTFFRRWTCNVRTGLRVACRVAPGHSGPVQPVRANRFGGQYVRVAAVQPDAGLWPDGLRFIIRLDHEGHGLGRPSGTVPEHNVAFAVSVPKNCTPKASEHRQRHMAVQALSSLRTHAIQYRTTVRRSTDFARQPTFRLAASTRRHSS